MAEQVDRLPHKIIGTGRLRSEGETGLDRFLLIVSHLWLIVGVLTATLPLVFVLPLVVWLVRKDQSPLIDDQGREILNGMLTLGLLVLVPIVGWLLLLVWGPIWIVSSIRAATAAYGSEYFRYPMTLRLIS